MQSGSYVVFSPPIPGMANQPEPWSPERTVLARLVSERVGTTYTIHIIRSAHPMYLVGHHYTRCHYQMEEVYEEDGKFYRDSTDEELRLP